METVKLCEQCQRARWELNHALGVYKAQVHDVGQINSRLVAHSRNLIEQFRVILEMSARAGLLRERHLALSRGQTSGAVVDV